MRSDFKFGMSEILRKEGEGVEKIKSMLKDLVGDELGSEIDNGFFDVLENFLWHLKFEEVKKEKESLEGKFDRLKKAHVILLAAQEKLKNENNELKKGLEKSQS